MNFLAIDNVTYQFTQAQLEKLEAEIKKGLPIIAMFHIPIYSEKFFTLNLGKNANNKRRPRKVVSIIGVPDDKLALCDKRLMERRKSTAVTKKVVEILSTNPLVKGVICGHIHTNIVDTLPNGAVITTSEGGYRGWAQEITIS